jgi:hypothetical protein
MSTKARLPADLAYIANIHDKRKSGKTRSFSRRFGRSQYNQGAFENAINDAYICDLGFESDIRRWEKVYKREYYDFLIRKKTNYKQATEWIDPKHTEIDCLHIKNTMESIVREEKLHIRRIKSEHLQRLVDDKDFINDIRSNREKYTETIYLD